MELSEEEIGELEISPETVHEKLDCDEDVTLIDIRTPRERECVQLEDDEWVEMNQVPEHVSELKDKERPLVIYCHHGQRSLKVARFLNNEGVDDVYSLAGGIDYWARQIDEDLPTY